MNDKKDTPLHYSSSQAVKDAQNEHHSALVTTEEEKRQILHQAEQERLRFLMLSIASNTNN